jgi:hypothetical protein
MPARTTTAPRRAPAAKPSGGGLSRQTVATLTSAGLVLPGGLLLVAALLRPPRHHETPDGAARQPAAASAASSAAPAPHAGPPGCALERPAQRIAEAAYAPVPILVSTLPDGERAVLGLAAAKDQAVGLTIEPSTLRAFPTFKETVPDGTLLNVVPLVRGKSLDFGVDVADPALASARTIDGSSRFTVGVSPEGFVRRTGTTISVLWPGKSKNPTITTPRVASVASVGHAIAFRHGGQEGKVLVGWLKDDGSKLADLKAVGTDAALSGTPAIAANAREAVVAFATKATPDDGWRIELADAPSGGAPGHSSVFVVPPGGPSGEAISPVVEALPNGRFLLQWTEGSAGNRAVRAAILAQDPTRGVEGEPVTLSTPEQNAGQGSLWVHGNRSIAFYLVKAGSSHELWGASLKCH